MTIDDRSRSDLLHRLDEVLGPEIAMILMDHLPPTTWRDLATVHDLENQSVLHRSDMAQLGGELRSEMAQLGGDLRSEMAQLGGDLRSEMAQLGGDLRSEMAQLGGDLRSEMALIRTDLDARTDLLRSEISNAKNETLASLRGELANQTRTLVLGLFAMFAGLAGVLIAVRPG